ncbi:anion transporter [Saccharopolyspora lacisalsi]|uniref:Anion transporter n=1 Tax=Halosaccharopolyspora lacisalsi TaxID=1000566 RepID=A0A839E078_9PSEU|nr:SLC13 family permease [Halosaccharopolyspora lacisalsi]MBA8827602.1 anion transporter [Halosaccharopolyspora lacisalsi]
MNTSSPGRVLVEYATPSRPAPARREHPHAGGGWAVGLTLVALGALGFVAAVSFVHTPVGTVTESSGIAVDWGAIGTMLVFTAAVAGWVTDKLDDTFVALTAAAALVVLGTLDPEDLFTTLGAEPIWLLVVAFVLAAGVNRTGLPTRLAIALAARATTARQLTHLLTAGLVITALLVPSTSGRAALVLPVFTALAGAFAEHRRLVRALALLFPSVVLLSAIATLVGAGAHLVTSQVLAGTTGAGIGFGRWLLLGLPLAVVSSHLATELILLVHTRRRDRRVPLRVDAAALREQVGVGHRVGREELRAAALLGIVIALWSTGPLHGFPPALVALAGALLITSPRLGTVRLGTAVSEVPWALLLFMAATAALGTALTSSGAASWLAGHVLDVGSGTGLLILVIVLSVAAHLLVQSRSARSSVLIPLVIPAATAVGMNPAALAFASTAGAGFCHTLPSSAKPVAMFARVEGVTTYDTRDLAALAAPLGLLTAALVLLCSLTLWPYLGLPLY